MRIRAVVAALALASMAACGTGGGLFRQYEYDEETYLSLDGRATLYINASIPALNALRGTSFDPSPNATIDREAVRRFFSTPVTRVNGQVSLSRRGNRRFVHVKIDVDDIRRLSEAAPFAWSAYTLTRDGDQYKYLQVVGPAAGRDARGVGWSGREIVAFRLHLPSRIQYHNNALPERGNILAWEQTLTDRLRGVPLTLDARMATESILYTTLWLFGWTFIAVAVTFVAVIWWIFRRAPAVAAEPTP